MSESAQILHAVEAMIERYGHNACHEAAIRVRELSDRGDPEGARLWREVEAQLLARNAQAQEIPETFH